MSTAIKLFPLILLITNPVVNAAIPTKRQAKPQANAVATFLKEQVTTHWLRTATIVALSSGTIWLGVRHRTKNTTPSTNPEPSQPNDTPPSKPAPNSIEKTEPKPVDEPTPTPTENPVLNPAPAFETPVVPTKEAESDSEPEDAEIDSNSKYVAVQGALNEGDKVFLKKDENSVPEQMDFDSEIEASLVRITKDGFGFNKNEERTIPHSWLSKDAKVGQPTTFSCYGNEITAEPISLKSDTPLVCVKKNGYRSLCFKYQLLVLQQPTS